MLSCHYRSFVLEGTGPRSFSNQGLELAWGPEQWHALNSVKIVEFEFDLTSSVTHKMDSIFVSTT